jgi:3-oxoacyl-[acyl-carrier protein] reductase
MDLGLEGTVCIVTGASLGIGRATAERLAEEGAHVVLVGRNAERLHEAADAVGGTAVVADVTEPAAAAAIVAAAEELGPLGVLVNNAGTTFARSVDELTDEDWRAQYELHVIAPMRLMREAAPRMAAGGGGRIVNVCSSAGKRPSLTNAAYSVTKAAQLSLSRTWADLHAADGVLVNAVTPGPVGSELWLAEGGMADQTAAAKGVSRAEALAAQEAKVPLGRFAEPGEVADVIVFLCSARSSTVTGAAWSVDGGAVAIIV